MKVVNSRAFFGFMKRLILTLFFLGLMLPLCAQGGVDRMFIDTRGAWHQYWQDGVHNSKFEADHLNLNIFGHINDKVDYRLRQRLNKKVFDENNIFNATDFLYINWQATEKWSFLFGKSCVLIGGYEYDAVPIDVYFYSKFCNNLYQGFTLGASASYRFAPSQSLVFQICDSPLSLGFENVYAYNLAWMGRFNDVWNTIWSFNMVEDREKKMINYISLGNHFQWDDLLFDLDLMNRGSFRQKDFFATDFTIISKIIWSVGAWNICAKGGYECNSVKNVDENGRPFDEVIAPGTKYIYAGAGLEYFPLGRDDVRLHAVYYRDNSLHRDNFDLGVTWKIDIIK